MNFNDVMEAMKPKTMYATLNGNKVMLKFSVGDPGILIFNLNEKGETITEKSKDGVSDVCYAVTFGFDIYRKQKVIGSILDLQPVEVN